MAIGRSGRELGGDPYQPPVGQSALSITSQSFVARRYAKALSPVIALPTINVFISRVPS